MALGGDGFGKPVWLPTRKSRSLKRVGSALARCWPSTWKTGSLAEETGRSRKGGGPPFPMAPAAPSKAAAFRPRPCRDAKVDGRTRLLQHQTAFGLTGPRISIWCECARNGGLGKEPTYCWAMGPSPWRCSPQAPPPLRDYFKAAFCPGSAQSADRSASAKSGG